EVNDRANLDRDVVARDHVLRRHVHDDRAQIDAHHALNERDHDDQARALDGMKAAELENHAALELGQDLECTQQEQNDDGEDDQRELEHEVSLASLSSRYFCGPSATGGRSEATVAP